MLVAGFSRCIVSFSSFKYAICVCLSFCHVTLWVAWDLWVGIAWSYLLSSSVRRYCSRYLGRSRNYLYCIINETIFPPLRRSRSHASARYGLDLAGCWPWCVDDYTSRPRHRSHARQLDTAASSFWVVQAVQPVWCLPAGHAYLRQNVREYNNAIYRPACLHATIQSGARSSRADPARTRNTWQHVSAVAPHVAVMRVIQRHMHVLPMASSHFAIIAYFHGVNLVNHTVIELIDACCSELSSPKWVLMPSILVGFVPRGFWGTLNESFSDAFSLNIPAAAKKQKNSERKRRWRDAPN